MELEDTRHPAEKCQKPLQSFPPVTLDALDTIYARELQDLLKTSKLFAIFTRDTTHFTEYHQAKILFFKAKMKTLIRSKHIVKEAVDGTEFCNLLPLFNAKCLMVYSQEKDITSLLEIDKKLAKFNLLCAVMENRILSVSQLQALASIPNIDSARAGVVQTLQSGAQNVVRSLQAHQNTLVQQLQQRAEQLK